MAVRTITEAGGNYNVTGTWVEGVVPTAADDVIALANGKSGALTITAAAACRSVDLSNYKSTVKNNGFTWSVGTSTNNAGLALKMGSEAKYSFEGNAQIKFISTVKSSEATQKVTPNGESLGNLTFEGVAAEWVLEAALTGAEVELKKGALNTNGKACTVTELLSLGASTRVLTLGSSAITVTGAGARVVGAFRLSSTGLTITSNTATITMTAAKAWAELEVANMNGTSLSMTGAGIVVFQPAAGGTTLANFTRTGTALKTDGIAICGNFTVTGTCTLTGNSAVNRLKVESGSTATTTLPTPGTTRTITAAAVSLTNVDFEDMAGEGAAKPFTGTSLGDCLGNSGITFTTAKTIYKRAGNSAATENWSQAEAWSLEANVSAEVGGAANARVPLPQDTVRFDKWSWQSSLGSIVMKWDMPRACRHLEMIEARVGTGESEVTTPVMTIYGTLTLVGSMPVKGEPLQFSARSAQGIKAAGNALPGVTILAPGGTYTVEGTALEVTKTITVSYGTFSHNNLNVTAFTYVSIGEGTRAVELGTGTLKLTGIGVAWNIVTTGLTLTAGSSTIELTNTATSSKSFESAGLTGYGTITAAGQNIITKGSFTCVNMVNNTAGFAKGLFVTEGTTITLTGYSSNGSAGSLARLESTVATKAFHLKKTSGIVSVDYQEIKDSHAEGGAEWYAGTHSTNVSGNEGWKFEAPPAGIAMII